MALTIVKIISPVKVSSTTAAAETIVAAHEMARIFGFFEGGYGTHKKGFISHIIWLNPTSAGHLAVVKDLGGKEIASFRCESANESQVYPVLGHYDGIVIDDLDSGTIYIYGNGSKFE